MSEPEETLPGQQPEPVTPTAGLPVVVAAVFRPHRNVPVWVAFAVAFVLAALVVAVLVVVLS